jgi:cobalamin biosynthesis Mg chelatase CobN
VGEGWGGGAPRLRQCAHGPASRTGTPAKGTILVTFYRSYLTSGDTAPVDALIHALRAAGFQAYGAFAPSLKAPGVADWLSAHLASAPPVAIINATAFSAKSDDGATPFDAPLPRLPGRPLHRPPPRLGRLRPGPVARRPRHARRPARG